MLSYQRLLVFLKLFKLKYIVHKKESTGFEPARRCYRFAGFRVRCITTLPTLHNSINYIKFKQKFNLFLVVDTKK